MSPQGKRDVSHPWGSQIRQEGWSQSTPAPRLHHPPALRPLGQGPATLLTLALPSPLRASPPRRTSTVQTAGEAHIQAEQQECGRWAVSLPVSQAAFICLQSPGFDSSSQLLKEEGVVLSINDLHSRSSDQTCILCVGRQILNHWTTREVRTHF